MGNLTAGGESALVHRLPKNIRRKVPEIGTSGNLIPHSMYESVHTLNVLPECPCGSLTASYGGF